MKEKLLYLCKFNPFCTYGGAAIRNRAITYLLSKRFDIHVVCFSSSDPDLLDDKKRVYPVSATPNLITGLWVEQSFSVARFHSRPMARLIQRLVQDHDFSVIYISELAMFQYVKNCATTKRPKIVLDCHNVESTLLREGIPHQSWWQRPLFYFEHRSLSWFERQAIQESDLIIFVSEGDQELANNLADCRNKAIVIPNCLRESVIPDNVEAPTDSKFNRFAIVGTLDWHANRCGIKWFIDQIWEKYASEHPDAELFLIGKKYKKSVNFTGKRIKHFYNVENVGQLLRSVDICLAPLLYGGGSRLKILEYFAHRKPVIATSKAAQGLDITPDIHYLKADNYLEFQRAIGDLLDSKLRKRLVQNGLDLLQSKYDINLYQDRLFAAL